MTEATISKKYAAQARWREKNPEARLAHIYLRGALRAGLVTKQPCQVCGDDDAEGHHPDYSRPGLVVWLCRRHHIAAHRAMKCEVAK